MAEHVELYRSDEDGEYRWRRRAANGEIVAESGEGYANEAHARDMATKLNEGVELVDMTTHQKAETDAVQNDDRPERTTTPTTDEPASAD